MMKWFGHVIGGDFDTVRVAMKINEEAKKVKEQQRRD